MKAGLYQPDEFKDNCGFGLIAHMQGEPSHHLLQTAVQALTCMTHRGGINADGKTGDGCGLLIQKPDGFLRAIAKQHFNVDLPRQYAVGMVFLNQDDARADAARENMNREILAEGLDLVGWRQVPIDTSVLGRLALERLPKIEQVFIGGEGLSDQEFAIKLFSARRRSSVSNAADTDHYICSFSHKTIIYKGLMMPADLTAFFPDLSDERLQTAICVFHQRFSTNTLPKWPLAQPFRFLAHNGEINTITGNRNWAQARRTKFTNDLMDLDELGPLVNRVGSDSSSMDNMLELMVTGGIDLFRGVRMIIPPAWQNVETMDPDLRAFYEYNSMHMEPWDGPAGVVMTKVVMRSACSTATACARRAGSRPRTATSPSHRKSACGITNPKMSSPRAVSVRGRSLPWTPKPVRSSTPMLSTTASSRVIRTSNGCARMPCAFRRPWKTMTTVRLFTTASSSSST